MPDYSNGSSLLGITFFFATHEDFLRLLFSSIFKDILRLDALMERLFFMNENYLSASQCFEITKKVSFDICTWILFW